MVGWGGGGAGCRMGCDKVIDHKFIIDRTHYQHWLLCYYPSEKLVKKCELFTILVFCRIPLVTIKIIFLRVVIADIMPEHTHTHTQRMISKKMYYVAWSLFLFY